MREEEKLAGDVYRYFYNMYGSSVFQNIAGSRGHAHESVLSLLNQYGIADPAVADLACSATRIFRRFMIS